MAKRIKQYRYYAETAENYPKNLTIEDLATGSAFET
jgi:hypothetical protein